ncbi:XRE family transcriptional regulator [Salmonella enterica subsp. enterica serovar Typhimurium]|nr:XRE family transcriptional regulator [Salmonella enterica subsp. enterica serovar Typhimurium]
MLALLDELETIRMKFLREEELIARLQNQYENCNLTIRRGSQDGLSIVGAADGDKKRIQSILQETWESADDWFY